MFSTSEEFKRSLAKDPKNTIAHSYIVFGLVQTFASLIQSGIPIDANAQNSVGNTPLHYAMVLGDLKATLFLLEQGANLQAVNNRGQTPATYAMSILGREHYTQFAGKLIENLRVTERVEATTLGSREASAALALYSAITGLDGFAETLTTHAAAEPLPLGIKV